MSPLVSIIIPAYNVAPFVEESLRSAMSQTHRNIEIILVDDGSTDHTLDIAEKLMAVDKRIKLIERSHQGQSCARNAALEVASGEWVTFLDADDLFLPTTVQKLLEVAQATHSDIVTADFTTNLSYNAPEMASAPYSMSGTQALIDMLYQKRVNSSLWSKIFRKSVLDGERLCEGIIYEDLEYLSRVLPKAGKVTFVPAVVYKYRQVEGSTLHTFSEKRFDVLEVTKNIEERLAGGNTEAQRAARSRRLSANFNVLGVIASNGSEKRYEDVVQDCYDLIKRYRCELLWSAKVRSKNKIGILFSYLGKGPLMGVLKKIYR